jgi:hypothetical protein
MKSKRNIFALGTLSFLAAFVACDRPEDRSTGVGAAGLTVPDRPQFSVAATIHVADVEQLYAAVNDPANEGATIALAPGTYVLSATNAGSARPNGGRLELQRDMSLYGVANDRSAVVIDGTGLPLGSYVAPFGRTAPIRIGRGVNAVEWLTVLGTPTSAAAVAAELTGTPSTHVRIAHVVAAGSTRGVDIRNAGATMAGRRIDAEVVDNDLSGPSEVQGMSEGIRISNFIGPDRGVIVASLSGNRTHGFQIGLLVVNNRSSNASVQVRSSGDRFFQNSLGALIIGGLGQAPIGVANANTVTVEAYGSQFVDNTMPITGFDPAGIRVVGGLTTILTNAASGNTVSVALWGSKVARNQRVDFEAYGARMEPPSGVAGTNNHVTIALQGVSKQIDVNAIASEPVDPTGSNTVTVIR